jgi:hypothetical protein
VVELLQEGLEPHDPPQEIAIRLPVEIAEVEAGAEMRTFAAQHQQARPSLPHASTSSKSRSTSVSLSAWARSLLRFAVRREPRFRGAGLRHRTLPAFEAALLPA